MAGSRLSNFRFRLRRRSKSGSAAIEFAFIAPVFFLFLFGILEGGIMFFGRTALMNSVQNAARLIRTGQAQNGGMQQGAFKTEICNGISALLNCANLTVDVQAYPTGFSSGGLPSPLDSNGNLNSGQNNYNTGGACDVVAVRAFYRYAFTTPLISPLFGKGGNNFTFLTAAAVVRNEPFGANSC